MIITIDAVKTAEELADFAIGYPELLKYPRYIEGIRDSDEWRDKYEYYFKILTNNAHIK